MCACMQTHTHIYTHIHTLLPKEFRVQLQHLPTLTKMFLNLRDRHGAICQGGTGAVSSPNKINIMKTLHKRKMCLFSPWQTHFRGLFRPHLVQTTSPQTQHLWSTSTQDFKGNTPTGQDLLWLQMPISFSFGGKKRWGRKVRAMDYLRFKMLWGTISPGVMGHLPDRGVLPGGGEGKGTQPWEDNRA